MSENWRKQEENVSFGSQAASIEEVAGGDKENFEVTRIWLKNREKNSR